MTLRILIFSFLLGTFLFSVGQDSPEKDRQTVLRQNKVGQVVVFDRSKPGDYNRTELTYLGRITSKEKKTYKIVTSNWFWGSLPRATGKILIFDGRNKYIGNYYVTMIYDLPDKIEDNELVFVNDANDDCDPKLITKVSFQGGPPKQFFLKCKGNSGDIYSFSTQ